MSSRPLNGLSTRWMILYAVSASRSTVCLLSLHIQALLLILTKVIPSLCSRKSTLACLCSTSSSDPFYVPRYAHDLLTSFMEVNGFRVTRHYLGLETAWRAEFQHLKGGRTIGINSEMDALQGMGHACGHNLIAISGVGVALALKAALQTHNIPGKVVLLGTPGSLQFSCPCFQALTRCIVYSGRRRRWKGDTTGERWLQGYGRLYHVCPPSFAQVLT